MTNRVTLVGNLGSDPELKMVASGALLTLRVATSESYKARGEWKTETTWHNVEVWGPQADRLMPLLRKGDGVFVEGSIRNSEYVGQDGGKRFRSCVKAFKVVGFTAIKLSAGDTDPAPDPGPPPEEAGQPGDNIPF